MNKFVFCVETESGLYYGILKATDGRHAKEKLTIWLHSKGWMYFKNLSIEDVLSEDLEVHYAEGLF